MLGQAAILALITQCAPDVAPHTMASLIATESSGNPYAIGVVGMHLVDQPRTLEEALETAMALLEQGANISVGLGQINKNNFTGLDLTLEQAFDPCKNLQASSKVLTNCYERATKEMGEGQQALKAALSCYYSNNFSRGFVKEAEDRPSYLTMIANNSDRLKTVPEIQFSPSDIKEVDPANREQQVPPAAPGVPINAIEDLSHDIVENEDNLMSWDVLGEFN